MEELLVEFELKAEEETKFKAFEEEVKEKVEGMAAFKRTFQKFQLTVETMLKRVAYVMCTHEGKHLI